MGLEKDHNVNITATGSKGHGGKLHDFLALGDIQRALSVAPPVVVKPTGDHDKKKSSTVKTKAFGTKRKLSDSHSASNIWDRRIDQGVISSSAIRLRLPLLLRHLAVLQRSPYYIRSSGISTDGYPQFKTKREKLQHEDGGEEEEENYTRMTQVLVSYLGCVAATHPTAEEMEVIVSHLVPMSCKRFFSLPAETATQQSSSSATPKEPNSSRGTGNAGGSKSGSGISSLKRITPSHPFHTPLEAVWRGNWDKTSLEKAITSWTASTEENNTLRHSWKGEENHMDTENLNMTQTSLLEPDEEPTLEAKATLHPSVHANVGTKRKSKSTSISMSMLQQNQETTVGKALLEVTSLLMASLDQSAKNANQSNKFDGDFTGEKQTVSNSGDEPLPNEDGTPFHSSRTNLVLPTRPDSLWVEYSSSAGGSTASGGADTAAMIAAIMHCSPILRHAQVATALCLTGLPRMQYIITRMAVNCPSSTQCILRGCVDALLQAHSSEQRCVARVEAAKRFEKLTTLNNTGGGPSGASKKSSRQKTTKKQQHDDDGDGEDAGTNPVVEAQRALSVIRDQAIRVKQVSSTSIYLIADFSQREASHAIRLLEQTRAENGGIFSDVVLHLYMRHDRKMAVKFLLKELEASHIKTKCHAHGAVTRICHKASTTKNKYTSQHTGVDVNMEGLGRRRTRRFGARSRMSSSRNGTQNESFIESLSRDEGLVENVRSFFVQLLSDFSFHKDLMDVAFWTNTVHALGLFLLKFGIGKIDGKVIGLGSTFSSNILFAMLSFLDCHEQKFGLNADMDGAAPRPEGPIFGYMLAIGVLLCSLCCDSVNDQQQTSTSAQKALKSLITRVLQNVPSGSIFANVFATEVTRLALSKREDELKKQVLQVILKCDCISSLSSMQQSLGIVPEANFLNACIWIRQNISRGLLIEIALRDDSSTSFASHSFEFLNDASRLQKKYGRSVTSNVIVDDSKLTPALLCNSANTLPYLQQSALDDASSGKMPQIMPFALSNASRNVTWHADSQDSGQLMEERHLILVQLYYSIWFTEICSKPFCQLDLNTIPIEHIIEFCRNRSSTPGDNFSIIASVAEIAAVQENSAQAFPRVWSGQPINSLHNATIEEMTDAIRCAVLGLESGERAELLYYRAQLHLPVCEVDAYAAAALASQRSAVSPKISYTRMALDPLTVLKCPVKVSRNSNLRLILLSILMRLLEANNGLLHRQTADKIRVAKEYKFARDLVAMKAIAKASNYGRPLIPVKSAVKLGSTCRITSNFSRLLIACNPGLMSALVIQGCPEVCLDWILKSSPECSSHVVGIIDTMTNNRLLTTSERMSLLDFALRTVFHFGSEEYVENRVVSLALSSLASSFHLIVGPVGLPVNVMCKNEGEDATNEIRDKAFRIMHLLSHTTEKRESTKRDVATSLSALIGLCRSEAASTASIGGKRKAVLTELLETATRVQKSLGGAQKFHRPPV